MKNDITPTDSVCPIFLEPIDAEQIKADQAEIKAQAKAQADKVAARQAVLAKLGLTADEVAALLS
jgi:hypothetical protein